MHPPVPVGSAREVGRVDLQPGARFGTHSEAGPEEVGMSEHQLGWHDPFGQQALRPVEVGQQGFEQPRALRETALDRLPLGARQNERDWVERPGPIRTLRVGIHVVSDAVFDNQPPREVEGRRADARASTPAILSTNGRHCGRNSPAESRSSS